jgi:FAD:protein FMN transferase
VAPHRFTFRAMAAENEVQLHADDFRAAQSAAQAAIDEVRRIEAKYSRYRPESLLSRINAAAGGAPVEIDEETRGLLLFADACWRQSEGLFDATSGVLRRVWRFPPSPLGEGRGGGGATVSPPMPHLPTDADLAPILALIGWQRVELTAATIRLPIAGMELDFGGFGKEYAVDRAAMRLRDAGIASGMVNLAGDLTILGPQPDGSPWRVGIRHPRKAGMLIATVPVYSGAIATSGDYERFIEVDGVRHCHVLDPRNGRAARGFQSVTVHAPSCLVAGSASTIAMLEGADAGLAWLRSLGLAHLAVLEDGRLVDAMGEAGAGL